MAGGGQRHAHLMWQVGLHFGKKLLGARRGDTEGHGQTEGVLQVVAGIKARHDTDPQSDLIARRMRLGGCMEPEVAVYLAFSLTEISEFCLNNWIRSIYCCREWPKIYLCGGKPYVPS